MPQYHMCAIATIIQTTRWVAALAHLLRLALDAARHCFKLDRQTRET